MAAWLDVAGRLAEGRPAVEHTQLYVRACRAVGYEHPDLTAGSNQVRDWYDVDDGLDLHLLDADCAELRAADTALTEALRRQRDQTEALAAAWSGSGAEAAVAFVRRHCDAANAVLTKVRVAVQRCESLRDGLWRLIDSKVGAAIAIDDRAAAQRPVWSAAAVTVTTGAGDRPAAQEVITHQVKPYVDNDIRNDWVTAMRVAQVDAAAAYDAVIDGLAGAPHAHFEIPGDLGPAAPPPRPGVRRVPVSAALPLTLPATPSLPAAAAAPSPPATSPAAPAMSPAAGSPLTLPDLGSALGGGAGIPGTAGGLSGLGGLSGPGGLSGLGGAGSSGGLGGLASRIVAAMAGSAGSGDPFTDTSADGDPPGAKDPPGSDEPKKLKDKSPPEAAASPGGEAAPMTPPATPAGQPVAAVPAAGAPADGAPPAAPPENAPPAQPPPEASTPCEIAANELPQAGR